jgi:hypothetical protein
VGYGAMAHDGMVTTLPKIRPGATGSPQQNPLLYLTLGPLTLPKTVAFGKVSCMEKHRLLPQMTASLYLGQHGG